jgi:2-dehydropantoate 2-reductase
MPRAALSGRSASRLQCPAMKFLVMGAGGVGGYFGGRLAEVGEDVWFVARGRHLEAIQKDGLRVSSLAGDFEVRPAQATDEPAAAGAVEVVLMAVKSWQTAAAARALRPVIGPETVVVSLQNGATAAEEIGEVLGMEHMLGGLCRILAFVSAPGQVTHAGMEPTVFFGEPDGSRSDRAERLLAAFRQCRGVTSVLSDDIERDIWTKFLFISAVSGVGAVSRVPAALMRTTPETRALLEAAVREAEAIARARGVALPEDIVARTLAFVDGLPEQATASMQRDVMEGRPSELEAQSGAVVRLGRALGLPTPVHGFIYGALKPLELRARHAHPDAGGA